MLIQHLFLVLNPKLVSRRCTIKNHPVYLTSPFAKALLVYFSAYANRSGCMERPSSTRMVVVYTRQTEVPFARWYRVIGRESGRALVKSGRARD